MSGAFREFERMSVLLRAMDAAASTGAPSQLVEAAPQVARRAEPAEGERNAQQHPKPKERVKGGTVRADRDRGKTGRKTGTHARPALPSDPLDLARQEMQRDRGWMGLVGTVAFIKEQAKRAARIVKARQKRERRRANRRQKYA